MDGSVDGGLRCVVLCEWRFGSDAPMSWQCCRQSTYDCFRLSATLVDRLATATNKYSGHYLTDGSAHCMGAELRHAVRLLGVAEERLVYIEVFLLVFIG